MKLQNLKNMTATLFFTLAILGSSTVSTAQVIESRVVKTEVTLTSRYTGGNFSTASYSFKFSSQDINVTKNNMEILFEGREDSKDYFSVSMAVDDDSLIYDLGESSCKEIKTTNPSKLNPAITAEVKMGHCYLTVNNDESGRTVTLFRVVEHNKSHSVRINEIEVLEKTFN